MAMRTTSAGHAIRLPLPLMIGAGLLLLCLLVITTAHSGRQRSAGADPRAELAAAIPPGSLVRSLAFADRRDGGIEVTDARTGHRITTLAPETNAFIRSVMRGLVRERKLWGLGADEPFVLAQRPDGGLTLADPATGRMIELNAFGPSNVGAFAELLGPRHRTE
jgi:putative photosynthetic complex assembly protein